MIVCRDTPMAPARPSCVSPAFLRYSLMVLKIFSSIPSPARKNVNDDPNYARPQREPGEQTLEEVLPRDDTGGDVPRDDGDRQAEQPQRSDQSTNPNDHRCTSPVREL